MRKNKNETPTDNQSGQSLEGKDPAELYNMVLDNNSSEEVRLTALEQIFSDAEYEFDKRKFLYKIAVNDSISENLRQLALESLIRFDQRLCTWTRAIITATNVPDQAKEQALENLFQQEMAQVYRYYVLIIIDENTPEKYIIKAWEKYAKKEVKDVDDLNRIITAKHVPERIKQEAWNQFLSMTKTPLARSLQTIINSEYTPKNIKDAAIKELNQK
jgi:carboxylesterase type B